MVEVKWDGGEPRRVWAPDGTSQPPEAQIRVEKAAAELAGRPADEVADELGAALDAAGLSVDTSELAVIAEEVSEERPIDLRKPPT